MTDLLISDRVKTREIDLELVNDLRAAFNGVPAVVGAMLMG